MKNGGDVIPIDPVDNRVVGEVVDGVFMDQSGSL